MLCGSWPPLEKASVDRWCEYVQERDEETGRLGRNGEVTISPLVRSTTNGALRLKILASCSSGSCTSNSSLICVTWLKTTLTNSLQKRERTDGIT